MKQKIVFFGTPEHAKRVLAECHNHENIEVVGVVTNPDRPVGRKKVLTSSPVKIFGQENNIPVLTPENFSGDMGVAAEKWLAEKNADFFIIVAYGVLVPQNIIDIPKNGAFNLHFSLLPKYRGASPIQSAILNGEKKSGISIFKLVLGMDAGEVFIQEEIDLEKDGASKMHLEAWDEMVDMGSQKILELCTNFPEFSGTPQDEEEATFCGKFSKSDGEIFLRTDSAEEMLRKFRAFSLWPGIFFFDEKQKRVKILQISAYQEETSEEDRNNESHGHHAAGELFLYKKKLLLQTQDGVLELIEVQKEGKKPVSGREYL